MEWHEKGGVKKKRLFSLLGELSLFKKMNAGLCIEQTYPFILQGEVLCFVQYRKELNKHWPLWVSYDLGMDKKKNMISKKSYMSGVFFFPNCIVLWNKNKWIINTHIKEFFIQGFYFQTKTLGVCLTVCILVCISSGYWEWNSFPPAAVCGGEDADHHGTETKCSLNYFGKLSYPLLLSHVKGKTLAQISCTDYVTSDRHFKYFSSSGLCWPIHCLIRL